MTRLIFRIAAAMTAFLPLSAIAHPGDHAHGAADLWAIAVIAGLGLAICAVPPVWRALGHLRANREPRHVN